MIPLTVIACTALVGLIWLACSQARKEITCPSWEDPCTRDLIEAALSWNDRRTDPASQDHRLHIAVRNYRGRWGR